MKSKKFMLIYIMFVCQLSYPLYFEIAYKEIGQFYIKDDAILTYIGSISFIGLSVCKLLAGIMLDYVSIRKTNIVLLTVMILHIFTL